MFLLQMQKKAGLPRLFDIIWYPCDKVLIFHHGISEEKLLSLCSNLAHMGFGKIASCLQSIKI